MGAEIEAKMKVESFEDLRARLQRMGAQHVGAVVETNAFFDTPERRLLAGDQGLRLRRSLDPQSGHSVHVITFKGPQAATGTLKNRLEIETEVADGDAARDLLQALGFQPTLSFEKRRETWKLDGCKIELDELPILGRFVEVEGPDEATVERVRAKLELNQLPPIKTGYITMLANHLRDTRSSSTHVGF